VLSVAHPFSRSVSIRECGRVHLEPGASTTVSFPVGPEQLAIWDARMRRTVETGTVDVMVGPHSASTVGVQLRVGPEINPQQHDPSSEQMAIGDQR